MSALQRLPPNVCIAEASPKYIAEPPPNVCIALQRLPPNICIALQRLPPNVCIAEASPESQERFAQVERMLLRVVVASVESQMEKSLALRFKNMTQSEPYILEWILQEVGSDQPTKQNDQPAKQSAKPPGIDRTDGIAEEGVESSPPQSTRTKAKDIVHSSNDLCSILVLLTLAECEHKTLPGIMMFNMDALGVLLVWCSVRATGDEKELLKLLLLDLKAFDGRMHAAESYLMKSFTSIINASQARLPLPLVGL